MDAAISTHWAAFSTKNSWASRHTDVLLLSTRLSGTVHNDPADRILIAAAQINNVPLVTADQLLIEYANSVQGTPVVDARM